MTEYVQGAVSEGHPNELAESGGRGLCETAGWRDKALRSCPCHRGRTRKHSVKAPSFFRAPPSRQFGVGIIREVAGLGWVGEGWE